ncbi:C39 family peptidase [Candidatus Nitrospira bockiana]
MSPREVLTGLLLVFVVIPTVGCTGPGRAASDGGKGAGESGWYVPGVPFFPQVAYQCGPASLASVLTYWGRPTSPDDIARRIYLPKLKGTLSLDMWQYAREQNVAADVEVGSIQSLEQHIRQGEPVVALLNLGYRWLPAGHFVVVVGVDPEARRVITYSGTEKDKAMPYDDFLRAWEKTQYWTLVVKPHATAGSR